MKLTYKRICELYVEELNEKYNLGDREYLDKVVKEIMKKNDNGNILSFEEFLDVLDKNHNKNPITDIEFNGEIVSIENIGKRNLIDIEVSGDNLFYANEILTHNSAYGQSDVGMENISESIGLVQTTDTMLAMIATEGQRELNQVMIKALKNRNTGILTSIILTSDYSKMRYTDFKNAVYQEPKDNHKEWNSSKIGIDGFENNEKSDNDGEFGLNNFF